MVAYYETNFAMVNHHGWSLEEIENLMPWERDIYVDMLITYIKEENERQKQRQNNG